jgi:hypothetical protein
MEVDDNASSPFKNNIYISGTQFDFASDSEISVSRSSDGGATWKTVAVDTKQIFPTNVDQFSDLAVGPDGTVYLNWIRCPANGPSGDCGGTTTNIMFSKSTDGGATWSTPAVAAKVKLAPDTSFCCFYGQLPNTTERVSDIPSNTVTGSGATAKVFFTVYNWTGTKLQVVVVASLDGGTTWKNPIVVNNANGDQFFPWAAFGNGKLAITWLDRRNDPSNLKYQPFLSVTSNGVFPTGHALSNNQSNPLNDGFGGGFMGDYRTHVWNGTQVDAVWMDTTTGTNNCQDVAGGVQF